MENSFADIQYCEELFNRFYDIGGLTSGGVTRLGYTQTEDQMHEMFALLGGELGYGNTQDEVGNTFVGSTAREGCYLIGSHLDSVIDGGRYDGVAGIIAGLMVLRWAKEEGLSIPVRVGAFRCEESSNFGCCTIGSGLVTKASGWRVWCPVRARRWSPSSSAGATAWTRPRFPAWPAT